MELLKEELGTEGLLVLKLSQGKLVLELNHAHKSGKAGLVVEQDASYFLDKLAELIPGQIDNAVIELLKAAVKAQP